MKENTCDGKGRFRILEAFSAFLVVTLLLFFSSSSVFCAEDRLIIKDSLDNTNFSVQDIGTVFTAGSLRTNNAQVWGSAPLVLGQDAQNRGIVITDKAETNPNNIYIGWNVGATLDYLEIMALQENIGWKSISFAPYGGNVGIGVTYPSYVLTVGPGGAYCDGYTWENSSSREYKKDIKELTMDEATEAFKKLAPVTFSYKSDPDGEGYVGFIAEDVPELVASRDRKGMNPMDVVAVLTKIVQEQQKNIEELTKKVTELESR